MKKKRNNGADYGTSIDLSDYVKIIRDYYARIYSPYNWSVKCDTEARKELLKRIEGLSDTEKVLIGLDKIDG